MIFNDIVCEYYFLVRYLDNCIFCGVGMIQFYDVNMVFVEIDGYVVIECCCWMGEVGDFFVFLEQMWELVKFVVLIFLFVFFDYCGGSIGYNDFMCIIG